MRWAINQLWIVAFIGGFLAANSSTAKAELLVDRTPPLSVKITGTITERDAEKFQEISNELEYSDYPLIILDSVGGDVSAAISIGKLVRKVDGRTMIVSKCYSSCALIFIAGVQRDSVGKLGLHRPYFSSAPQDREALEKQVPLMLSMLKGYVAEMNVTDGFYQQMVNTEPSRMAVYQADDFTALMPREDPVYAEIKVAHGARAFGITTAEMRQRYEAAKKCLSEPPRSSPVEDQICRTCDLLGIERTGLS